MSEQAPMFNIPPNRRNMANPSLLLLIPPSATAANNNINGNNGDSSAILSTIHSTPGTYNPSPMGPPITEVPRSGGHLRRKPPSIDFSKIDGSYSFSPSTTETGNTTASTAASKQYALATSESSRELVSQSQNLTQSQVQLLAQGQHLAQSQLLAHSQHLSQTQNLALALAHSQNPTQNLTQGLALSHHNSETSMNSSLLLLMRSGNVAIADLSQEEWNHLANSNSIVEIGKLGEGNGGSVSKCKLRSGSPVFALKLINADPNPEVQKQIIRELQYNRLCHCPNIVSYYGTFMIQLQSMIGIAMEYMGGGSLDAIYKRVIELDSTNRVNEKVLGKIADSVLKGLSYLHLQRIIHRDIKPSNILLDSQGHVKICDFGVSGDVVNSLATTFVGTQYYMAPERIMGKPYTVSCDVWSLGLSLLEVAQGKFPYHYQNNNPMGPIELLQLILEYEPQLQDVLEEGIFWSDSFKNFIEYCLKKNPDERPSPKQMLQHPWCIGQQQAVVNMGKFVKRLWGEDLE